VIGTAQAQTLLAYGLRGNLYRSSDFGSTWQQVELKPPRGALEFGLSGPRCAMLAIVMVGNGGSVMQQRRRPDLQRVQPPGPHFAVSVTRPAICWSGRAACTPRSPTAPKSIIRRQGFLEHSSSGQGDVA
jgi:hypothetical protein